MHINLTEAMKKASHKGFVVDPREGFLSPWQQESILYSNTFLPTKPEKLLDEKNNRQTAKKNIQNNNKLTLREHKENTKDTLREHKENTKDTLREHKENTKDTNERTLREQNLCVFSDENYVDKLQSLVGQQKKIMFFLLDQAVGRGTNETGPISYEKICNSCEIKYESMKMQIQRLTKKGLIARLKGKKSKGGYMQFLFHQHIKTFLLSIQQTYQKMGDKENTKDTNERTNSLYVSSKYIKPTTYGEEEKKADNLPPTWGDITYSDLEGFDEPRLIQVYREYQKNPEASLSANIIQDSINHLVFDLQNNNVNFKKPPAVVLTSMLKQGKPYSSITPEKYLSPKESAMAKYNDTQKIINAQRLAIEEDLQKTELTNWLQNMTGDDLLNQFYEPEKLQKIGNNKILKTIAFRDSEKLAKEYFIKEIWASRKQEILESLSQESVIDTASG